MWGVIAEAAATMDAGAVGQMLGALIGAGGIGGMGYMQGKTKQISVKMLPSTRPRKTWPGLKTTLPKSNDCSGNLKLKPTDALTKWPKR